MSKDFSSYQTLDLFASKPQQRKITNLFSLLCIILCICSIKWHFFPASEFILFFCAASVYRLFYLFFIINSLRKYLTLKNIWEFQIRPMVSCSHNLCIGRFNHKCVTMKKVHLKVNITNNSNLNKPSGKKLYEFKKINSKQRFCLILPIHFTYLWQK